jgi:hypothetical protein
MGINLGAGGRDIRKQAGKNLYTTGGGAVLFYLGVFAILARTELCLSLSLSLSLCPLFFIATGERLFMNDNDAAATRDSSARPARSSESQNRRVTQTGLNANLNVS